VGYHGIDPLATLPHVTPIDYLITIGLCVAPVSELRGGLPFALGRGLHPAAAYVLAVGANLLVVPILLVGFRWAESVLRRFSPTRRLLEAVLRRTRRKGRFVERFGSVGLVLLVAVPLPGTGAWTGALAAILLGLPLRRSAVLITLGVLIAGVVVLFASLGAFHFLGL